MKSELSEYVWRLDELESKPCCCVCFLWQVMGKDSAKERYVHFIMKISQYDYYYTMPSEIQCSLLCQSEGFCPLLLQITRPIRCTTTSHVITLTIRATAPARV